MKIINVSWILILLFGFLSAEASEFQEMMGKSTKHWMHVSKPQDIAILDRCEALYEKNNPEKLPPADLKIPPVVHFIWLGPNPFPPESVENVRMWVKHHPDWTFKFWTDRKRDAPCSCMDVCYVEDFSFPFFSARYHDSKNWGEKSDVLRFAILFTEGGIYVDHDANCLKNFSTLAQFDFFCGLETPHPPFVGHNITCGNGVIGARPGHPVIGKVIDLINEEWDELGDKYRGRDGYSRTQLVMERTYMKLTTALSSHLDQEGNKDIVLPAAYFFAKDGISPLYSRHFFAGSWSKEPYQEEGIDPSTLRALNKLHKKNHWLLWAARGALSINLGCFAGLFFYVMKKKKKRA